MSIFIADKWADWFWSSAEGRAAQGMRSRASLATASTLHLERDPLPFPFRDYPLPAHILLPSAGERKKAPAVKEHVLSGPLPQNAFRKIGDSLYVASPELAFVQLGAKLSLAELIAVGYEYCGSYAIDPRTGMASFGLPPVTDAAKLGRFANACPNIRGVKAARQAIGYIHDNSASPMETGTHMRMSLPSRRGGYCLPSSELNREVPLNANARRIYKRGSVRFDIYFPDAKLDVEFNGGHHESKMSSDAARDAAIRSMGYDTMTITMAQYRDYLAMAEIVRNIAMKHGIYLRKDRTGFTPARAALYRDLEVYRTGVNRR